MIVYMVSKGTMPGLTEEFYKGVCKASTYGFGVAIGVKGGVFRVWA